MNMTLKSIPKALHLRLKEVAKRNGRSLNAEITGILEKSCMAYPADKSDLLEKIRQTRASLGIRFNVGEIATSRKEGRK